MKPAAPVIRITEFGFREGEVEVGWGSEEEEEERASATLVPGSPESVSSSVWA